MNDNDNENENNNNYYSRISTQTNGTNLILGMHWGRNGTD